MTEERQVAQVCAAGVECQFDRFNLENPWPSTLYIHILNWIENAFITQIFPGVFGDKTAASKGTGLNAECFVCNTKLSLLATPQLVLSEQIPPLTLDG